MSSETIVQQRLNGPRPIRVLMADPDKSVHSMYQAPLRREGFELATAVSGLQCLARLRERVPDVLVLEPFMPWGGGDGVLAMMGEDPDLAIVPVMVLTSCRSFGALNGVARFPISDYQAKPLAPNRLAERIRGVLDHPRLRFTLGDHNGRLECEITRRTNGRVRNLQVEIFDGRIAVRGVSDSHHVKQLVVAAVLDAFEASESMPGSIELNIDVAPGERGRIGRRIPSETRNEADSEERDFSNTFAFTRKN